MAKKSASKPQSLLNKIVEVHFLDHVQHGKAPLACTLYGRVTMEEAKFIVVTVWETSPDDDGKEDNEERYTILTSTIERVRVLK